MENDSKSVKFFGGLFAALAGIAVIVAYFAGAIVIFSIIGFNQWIEHQRMNPTVTYAYMGGIIIYLLAGCVLCVLGSVNAHEYSLRQLRERASKKLEATTPVFYRCSNNGVTALVSRQRFDETVAYYQRTHNDRGMQILYVVPETMIFCVDHHQYPCNINNVRTGNFAEMETLTRACRIEDRTFFVPYSSFVDGNEAWHRNTFRILRPTQAAQEIRSIQIELVRKARQQFRTNLRYRILMFATVSLAVAGIIAVQHYLSPVLFK